jgi:hypothetical protein
MGLEPTTFRVTGECSSQLSYSPKVSVKIETIKPIRFGFIVSAFLGFGFFGGRFELDDSAGSGVHRTFRALCICVNVV